MTREIQEISKSNRRVKLQRSSEYDGHNNIPLLGLSPRKPMTSSPQSDDLNDGIGVPDLEKHFDSGLKSERKLTGRKVAWSVRRSKSIKAEAPLQQPLPSVGRRNWSSSCLGTKRHPPNVGNERWRRRKQHYKNCSDGGRKINADAMRKRRRRRERRKKKRHAEWRRKEPNARQRKPLKQNAAGRSDRDMVNLDFLLSDEIKFYF
ncbi:hypothetical protein F5878DRAFT_646841 [Lentinula raphanica]|uniref:Uncharacterized protein n=1 Tax=Lentinula raphanica TaxID=153919 RepID=A0AA38NXC2_9AGAR|nr:hypothetical protein F5878DRAFT_646841 [Lentinula raphanica]